MSNLIHLKRRNLWGRLRYSPIVWTRLYGIACNHVYRREALWIATIETWQFLKGI